ncbi:nSTAND1 domain-containing NTPase [Actinacidiphila acididurans]|uniref:AAA+ ATPase domain-containing protein n=1 Tax=Actinacidiphila acididurans TaxID=2784346 RepID=A0ABS2TTV2_9ACTN|nr:hypothetical protein [Actinacidiphila acididurans]MBM9506416.1 hypothetical protein [Actinacidiphila acididurans]
MPRQERPLESGNTHLLRFAADLRLLREKAGSPTYRQLALRAHASAASLSVAASGRKLPTLAVTMAYVEGCGGDTGAWRQRWHDVAAAVAVRGEFPGGPGPGSWYGAGERHALPYLGAASFRPDDAQWFFGRDALVTDLLERLRQRRVVTVTGPSGSGKTSLLNAGLLARLRARGHHGPIVMLTPGPHPMRDAGRVLARLSAGRPSGPGEPIVVIDQFEELFTLCGSPAERTDFLAAIGSAAAACAPDGRLVICTRADVHDRFLDPALPSAALFDDPLIVGPMPPEALHQAVTAPGARAGCRPEDALTAVLVAASAGQPGALPLVSAALREAWPYRTGGTLALSALRAAGGIDAVISRGAEAAWAQMPDELKGRARTVLLRMAARESDAAGPLPLTDLDDDPPTRTVLETLARARVVTLDRDRVAWAHASVPRAWTRLARWADADPEGLRVHRRLTDAARTWHTHGRPAERLYRGAELAEARALCARDDHEPTVREQEFLHAAAAAEAARDHAAAADRARLRGQQRLTMGLAAFSATLAAALAAVVTATPPLSTLLRLGPRAIRRT